MSFYSQKVDHAYKCYKMGVPRQKVYAVVEKDNKFVVLKCGETSKYKYALAGGGIEKGEDFKTAILRECMEELNMKVSFVRCLGKIKDKSKWKFKNKEFWVDDEMSIVYTKFESYGNNIKFGLDGEFSSQDIVKEISKEEMVANVAEFTYFGLQI